MEEVVLMEEEKKNLDKSPDKCPWNWKGERVCASRG